jgi:hypothetical protein
MRDIRISVQSSERRFGCQADGNGRRGGEIVKNHYLFVFAILLGVSQLASARAETLKSKLADMAAAVIEDSQVTSQEQQAAAAPPMDEAQQQAEARDAVNKALENARNEQK